MNSGGGKTLAKVRPAENLLMYSPHRAEAQGVGNSSECRIAVIGVGTGGSNTVSRLKESGSTSAKCVIIDTDCAKLRCSRADEKILIGQKLTKGRGVHRSPKLGKAAAEESRKSVEALLSKVEIAFVTAGLGGGTGAGAAPVVAEIMRSKGAATVGVVTMPFRVEKGRDKSAAEALAEMRRHCDTVVVIDNDKLAQLAPHLPMDEAFKVSDQVLANMIGGIVETMSTPSLINLDFADFKTIISNGGMAVVGMGESDAPNRAEEAVRNAFKTPLYDLSYAGATGALIHVTGDNRMTIQEANRVGEIASEIMEGNVRILWSAKVDPQQEGKLKVTLVMTGLDSPQRESRFGSIAPQLFNLEPCAEHETSLGIDFDLYQMERGAS
jgi:cell division protein FtsZ